MAERELRYIVLKLKDVEKLPKRRRDQLDAICGEVKDIREERGAMRDGMCIVVEKDWPEYEPTLAAILARMDRETACTDDGYCHDCEDVRHCGTIKRCVFGKRPTVGVGGLDHQTFSHDAPLGKEPQQ